MGSTLQSPRLVIGRKSPVRWHPFEKFRTHPAVLRQGGVSRIFYVVVNVIVMRMQSLLWNINLRKNPGQIKVINNAGVKMLLGIYLIYMVNNATVVPSIYIEKAFPKMLSERSSGY